MTLFAEHTMPAVKRHAILVGKNYTALDECLQGTGSHEVALQGFCEAYANILGGAQKSPHTVKNFFSAARKVMLSMEMSNTAQRVLREKFVVTSDVAEGVYGRAVERRVHNADNAAVYDSVTDYFDAMMRFVNSPVAAQRSVGLLAACGRRASELDSQWFEVVEDSNNLLFSGQSKGRHIAKDAYKIPCLISAQTFLDRLRKMEREMRKVSVVDRNVAMDQFADMVKWPSTIKCTARTLRAMYACMTYALYAPDKRQEWAWVNEVLGHEDHDQVTCQAYMRFKVVAPPAIETDETDS